MFQYCVLTQTDMGKKTDTIYRFYKKLFEIFSFGTDLYDLVDGNGKLIQANIPKDEVMSIVEQENITPVLEGYQYVYPLSIPDGSKRTNKAALRKYQPVKINIYNKLYVYVRLLRTKTGNSLKRNPSNCWKLLRAKDTTA